MIPRGSHLHIHLHLELCDMSKLSDEIAAVRGATDALAARVAADIDRLNTEIAALRAKVADGTVTEADLSNMQAIVSDLGNVDPAPPDGGGA